MSSREAVFQALFEDEEAAGQDIPIVILPDEVDIAEMLAPQVEPVPAPPARKARLREKTVQAKP